MGEVLKEIGIQEFKKLLEKTIKSGSRLYVEGPPGIGKSMITRAISEKAGKEVVEIYPPVLDIGDIVTKIPIKEREDHYRLCEIVAEELPREPGRVIFIDEMRHGEQTVLRMFYRLILEGKVGSTYSLPPNTAIIAASNPTEDVQTEELEGPLFDRFVHRVKLSTSVQDFKEYLAGKPYSHLIIGFLEFQPNHLAVKDDESGNKRYIVTPRRWDYLTEIKADDMEDWLWQSETVLPPGISAKFMEFVKKVEIYSKDVRDYINGREPFPANKADQIAVMTAIVAHVNNALKYEDIVNDILEMKMKGADEEVVALTVFQSIGVLKKRKNITNLRGLPEKTTKALIMALKKYNYVINAM